MKLFLEIQSIALTFSNWCLRFQICWRTSKKVLERKRQNPMKCRQKRKTMTIKFKTLLKRKKEVLRRRDNRIWERTRRQILYFRGSRAMSKTLPARKIRVRCLKRERVRKREEVILMIEGDHSFSWMMNMVISLIWKGKAMKWFKTHSLDSNHLLTCSSYSNTFRKLRKERMKTSLMKMT